MRLNFGRTEPPEAVGALGAPERDAMLRNPAPTICVTAAERVQNCGGPGRKPKNLATTFAEKPAASAVFATAGM
mgnify:CR=1 FL=1